MNNVDFSQNKPTLLILDEVDGAYADESRGLVLVAQYL
jgi:hypothetical protein